jgi:hypothetical protein
MYKVWLVLSCGLRVFPKYLGFLPQQKLTLRPIVVKHVYHEPLVRMNTRFPLLRFRSALHCGYGGITDIQDGLFFVLTRARTFIKR